MRTIEDRAALHAVAPPARFHLDGRMSVRSDGQNFSGSVTWDRGGGGDTLLLSGPLGQGAAEIRRRDGWAELVEADGKRVVEPSDALLMQRVLGLDLPLDGLLYWLSGQPRPLAPFKAGMDAQGRPAWIEQDGWRLEYERYDRHGPRWLPGRIVASRSEGLEFRVVVDHWDTP